MAPNIRTFSLIDAVPFENNPTNQITTLYNYGMINEFLNIHHRGERCETLQDFRKQVSEFEKKYEIPFALLEKVKQKVLRRSDSFSISLQNPIHGVNPLLFMDLVDLMRQAEILQDVQIQPRENQFFLPSSIDGQVLQIRHENGENEDEMRSNMLPPAAPPLNYRNVVVDILAVTHDIRVSSNLSRQQHQNDTEDMNCRRRVPGSLKLGKIFFPLTVQAGLSVLTSVFDAGGHSSAAEAKQLLHVAVISNMVGYIGCLADISLRHHNKTKAAEIMGRIGATAAVFGFLTMMGTLIELKPTVMIGLAALVTLVFSVAITKV